MYFITFFSCFIFLLLTTEASRILAVYPMPSISHQIVFRVLTNELLRKGHEVVVITTDPMYERDKAPVNLTEIDVHDISYEIWKREFLKTKLTKGNKADWRQQIETMGKIELAVFEHQLNNHHVQEMLRDKTQKFDLLIAEALVPPALIFSHVYKVPSIQISSFGTFPENLKAIGAPEHLFLYPTSLQQRIFNFTFLEYLTESYNYLDFDALFKEYEIKYNVLLRKIFGPDIPDMNELKKNIAILFMNVHPIWEFNRPVPRKLVYLGGLHQKPQMDLPKDLKSYLDSSTNGVIYVSFGTNVDPSLLPPSKIQSLLNVFAKLPYDILWKWDSDEMLGKSENIKIAKWLPQSDLLRHPNVKLFITQGGLQSSDEAITAGVPMVCIPMLGDQWYNMEQYVHLGIGLGVPMETLSEETLSSAIQGVLANDRYRHNVRRLRSIMTDSFNSSLERAMWWTEYVLKHRNTHHLHCGAANETLLQYFDEDLVVCFLLLLFTIFSLFLLIVCCFKNRKSIAMVKEKYT